MAEYYNPGSAFRVGSPFGRRISPITGNPEGHSGQDYPAVANTIIKAAGKGKVVVNKHNYNTTTRKGYGYYVVLEHLDTNTNSIVHTLYAHMIEQSSLVIGAIVEKNGTIGKVGSTGGSTGNHLHFEVRTGNHKGAPFTNQPVNPVSYDISGLTASDGNTPVANTSEQTTKSNVTQSNSEFNFPVCKADGSEYTAEELYGLLSDENSGYYLLGRHNFWHGGLHFTDEKFSHCVKESPVRSIAKGKVIAYRLNKEYPKVSGLLDKNEYQYSTGFCLVKHAYESPEKQPTPQEKMNPWKGKKITLKARRNVRNIEELETAANTDYELTLPIGTDLTIVDIGKVAKSNYYFAKVKASQDLTGKTKAGANQGIPSGTELYMATFTPEGEIVTSSGVALFDGSQVKVKPTKYKFNYYSLYMHLCSYNDYLPAQKDEKSKKQIITINATQLNARDKIRTAVDCKTIGYISNGATLEVLDTLQTGDITDIRGRIITGDVRKNNVIVKKIGDEVWVPIKQGTKSFITTPKPPKERVKPCYWEGTATVEVKNPNGIAIFKNIENDVLTGQIGIITKGNIFTFETTQKKIIKKDGQDILVAECKAKRALSYRAEGDTSVTTFWTTVDTNTSISISQVEPNQFDKVVTCDVDLIAGEALGYLGLYETPTEKGDKKTKRQAHVEVFFTEKNGVDYLLKNPLGLKDGKQFIRLPKGTKLIRQPIATDASAIVSAGAAAGASAANVTDTTAIVSAGAAAGASAANVTDTTAIVSAGAAAGASAANITDTTKVQSTKNSGSIFDTLDGYFSDAKKVLTEAKDVITEKVDQTIDDAKAVLTEVKDVVTEKIDQALGSVLGNTPAPNTETTQPQDVSDYILKYDHAFAIDTLKLEKDAAGKEWYLIATEKHSGRVEKTANSPEIISQHDWEKLGFQIIEEENDNADGFLDVKAMPPFFQQLYKQMDTNGDGKVDPGELKAALKDPELREKWSKFIALHPTEWRQNTNPIEQRFIEILFGPGKEIAEKLIEKGKELLDQEVARMKALTFWQDIKPALPQRIYHFHPVAFVDNLLIPIATGAITIEEARVRAFLRVIRVGEGTVGPIGYETVVGGSSFIKDHHKTYADHPKIRVYIRSINNYSTAAGAYQILWRTWNGYPAMKAKYKITDFTPRSQDRYGVILIIIRKALEDVKAGRLREAVIKCNSEWASLPGSQYGQRTEKWTVVQEKYDLYLKEELAGKSDLAVEIGGLNDLIGQVGSNNANNTQNTGSRILSGASWVTQFPTSISTQDLVSPFRENANNFIAALRAAGANITISATYRPPKRAYLMHWSFKIARENQDPRSVPPMEGVNINWVHTDAQGNYSGEKSIKAAREMVRGYRIVYRPSLTSNHTRKSAIDMTISWQGTLNIRDATGAMVSISTTPRTGAGNRRLHTVGASYNVRKLVSDEPHWSHNGR